MRGDEGGQLEPDVGEGDGRRVEQRRGGLLEGGEGGVLVGEGLSEAAGLGLPVPGALLLQLRREPATEVPATGAQSAVDAGLVGRVTGWLAGAGREPDARVADLPDERGFELIAAREGLIAPAQRRVEVAPEMEVGLAQAGGRGSGAGDERRPDQREQGSAGRGGPGRVGLWAGDERSPLGST